MNKTWKFPNKEELKPIYELPDPFRKEDGTRVLTIQEWEEHREYLKAMLKHYMYGEMPPEPADTNGEVISQASIFDGKAISETVRITFGPNQSITMLAEVVRPCKAGIFPVIIVNKMQEMERSPAEKELVCDLDYILIEYVNDQLAPDHIGIKEGPLPQAYPEYSWGAVAMWSWGYSRIIDYLETVDYVDREKIVATGHSRCGKVALCAAIYDERISLCAASCSGCGGAGCFRYVGGRLGENTGTCETVGVVTETLGYWFNEELKYYGKHSPSFLSREITAAAPLDTMTAFRNLIGEDNADQIIGKTSDEVYVPFDLHFVRALIAPRPLITTNGLNDTWANIYGSQIVWMASDEVYQFLDAYDKNVMYMREGGHEYLKDDWMVVIDFCEKMFRNKTGNANWTETTNSSESNSLQQKFLKGWKVEKYHYSWEKPGN